MPAPGRPSQNARDHKMPGWPDGYWPEQDDGPDLEEMQQAGVFRIPHIVGGKVLTQSRRLAYLRQEMFLYAYMREGTVAKAARKAKVSVNTVRDWFKHDTMGFGQRAEDGWQSFCDHMEEELLNRVENNPTQSNDLLKFWLSKRHPAFKDSPESLERTPAQKLWDAFQDMKNHDRAQAESQPLTTVEDVAGEE